MELQDRAQWSIYELEEFLLANNEIFGDLVEIQCFFDLLNTERMNISGLLTSLHASLHSYSI